MPSLRFLVLLVAAAGLAVPSVAWSLTVSAAASLRNVLPAITAAATYNFGGSDRLALQIENGAPADVYVAADIALAERLHRTGRCSAPRTFATNVLVLVTPASDPAVIAGVEDLARGPRKRLAVAAASVPAGAYTRQALERLGLSDVLRANTVSSEPDVTSVLSKVRLGTADAGFVYATDWRSARDEVRRVDLPANAHEPVRYGICVVERAGVDQARAGRFVRAVLGPAGRQELRAAGFGVPRLG
jgi:molybdate transport system substrate-binding protein